MFVALQTKDHSRVTSIASRWGGQLESLRDLARSVQLICPGCGQLLWLRRLRRGNDGLVSRYTVSENLRLQELQ